MEFKIDLQVSDQEGHKAKVISFIKAVVAAFYQLPGTIYQTRSRKGVIIQAKHMAMYLVNKNTKITVVDLGEKFGYDHSNVTYILSKYEKHLEWDKVLQKEVAELQTILTLKGLAES